MENMNKLLISEPPLQVLPSLAVAVGLNESIVLQQVHYWLRKANNLHDGKQWIYKTYAEWQAEFPFWSVRTVQRIILDMEKRGLLLSRDDLNKMSIDRTKWYTINYAALESLSDKPKRVDHDDKLAHSEDDNLSSPITRDYQDTTTSARGAEAPALNVAAFYEYAFGWLPSFGLVQQMDEMVKEYGTVAFKNAMETAALNGKRDLRYVKGILRRQQTGDARPEPAQPEPARGRWE